MAQKVRIERTGKTQKIRKVSKISRKERRLSKKDICSEVRKKTIGSNDKERKK